MNKFSEKNHRSNHIRSSSAASSSSSFSLVQVLLVVQSVLLAGYVGAILADADGELLKTLHLYVNWHKTPGVGGPYEHLFEPSNRLVQARNNDNQPKTQDREFRTGLNELKRIPHVAETATMLILDTVKCVE